MARLHAKEPDGVRFDAMALHPASCQHWSCLAFGFEYIEHRTLILQ